MNILWTEAKDKEPHQHSFGISWLYPKGTIRYVKKLIWFKWKVVKQYATIDFDCGADGGCVIYNKWVTI